MTGSIDISGVGETFDNVNAGGFAITFVGCTSTMPTWKGGGDGRGRRGGGEEETTGCRVQKGTNGWLKGSVERFFNQHKAQECGGWRGGRGKKEKMGRTQTCKKKKFFDKTDAHNQILLFASTFTSSHPALASGRVTLANRRAFCAPSPQCVPKTRLWTTL